MADFQHKHYARIAAILSEMRTDQITIDEAIDRFARMFQRDNPRFDWQRFMLAAQNTPMGKDADTAGRARVAGMPYR